MSAKLSARHLQAINARMVEGRAETAPEIDSIENEKEDDDIEETLKEEGSTIMSWTRRRIDRGTHQVSFQEKVQVRPIPAVCRCRSCRGNDRKKMRGISSSPKGSSENLKGPGQKIDEDTLSADENILHRGEEESGHSDEII